jgi:hypothetical protein
LINYYQILGVPNFATIADIKIAFRKLAKQYHPDKNPNGKEQFATILKAYEVLTNNYLKTQFDYNLNVSLNQTHTHHKHTIHKKKHHSFDEKEAQRRKYYDEHIKKYAKTYANVNTAELKKSTYNEFKYILLASPLAVILFVFIAFTVNQNSELPKDKLKNEIINKPLRGIEMGDVPFSNYFGRLHFDTTNKYSLTVKNTSNYDFVICFFTQNKFVRSAVLLNQTQAEILELPKDSLIIKICFGNNWDYDKIVLNNELYGNFTINNGYAQLNNKIKVLNNETLNFKDTQTNLFYITEQQFLNKNYDQKN